MPVEISSKDQAGLLAYIEKIREDLTGIYDTSDMKYFIQTLAEELKVELP
jgi:hypothetical protein